MWNIIKAQNYQTKRDNVTVYGILAGMVYLLAGLISIDGSLSDITGSLWLVYMGAEMPIVLAIITLILTARICGWDYADKTMNYEVLAGHSRGAVYWGRIITSMLWGIPVGIIMLLLPMLLFTVTKGWGVSMSLQGALLHLLLLLFPMLRLICEFALLTFLLKNCYAAMLIGWVLYASVNIIAMVAEETAEVRLTVQFAATNMAALLNFSNYTIKYIDGEDVMVFDTALDSALAVQSAAVSLLVGAVCLIIGYICFKKSDMA